MRKRDALRVVTRAVERYGIPVRDGRMPPGFTGDIDGECITLDRRKLNDEEALFLVLHLFGHTVQWNVSPAQRKIGLLTVKRPNPRLLARLIAYERYALGYSLQLLRDCGIEGLDQWLADYAECDAAYLTHFYRTGRKKRFRSFWRRGVPIMRPRRIPKFTPKFWGGRTGDVI
jgi:hypothetical protein